MEIYWTIKENEDFLETSKLMTEEFFRVGLPIEWMGEEEVKHSCIKLDDTNCITFRIDFSKCDNVDVVILVDCISRYLWEVFGPELTQKACNFHKKYPELSLFNCFLIASNLYNNRPTHEYFLYGVFPIVSDEKILEATKDLKQGSIARMQAFRNNLGWKETGRMSRGYLNLKSEIGVKFRNNSLTLEEYKEFIEKL